MNYISLWNFPFYLIKSIFVLTWNTICNFIRFVLNTLIYFLDFISPVIGSVYGKVNEKEFYRIISLAASAGGTLWGSIVYISDHAAEYITDATTLAFIQSLTTTLVKNKVLAIVVLIIFFTDFYRRKYQGLKHEDNVVVDPVRPQQSQLLDSSGTVSR